ncbi:MAG: putative metal-binding motif-containing protein [Deltaproteobacteria bacterium]|nr:putative metal-binding motif-containing protein [Deltaproteobacteria bacterium]
MTDQGSSFNIIARDASGGVVSEAQCLIGLFGTDNACAVNDDSGFNVTAPITDLAYGSCLSSLGAVLALEGVTCARNEDGDDYTVVDDCDDTDPAVGPGASEACDGIDNDCDGLIDDADPNLWPGSTTPWCLDRDGDSAGDLATITYACVAPAGAVNDCTDADDADAGVR